MTVLEALGGIGAQITIPAKIAGIVDFGREVQLELPDGLLIYAPTESVRSIVCPGREKKHG